MDNDTTAFPKTAAVQPGHSGSLVLDGSGALLCVTVARMNDVAALMATNSVPQTVISASRATSWQGSCG